PSASAAGDDSHDTTVPTTMPATSVARGASGGLRVRLSVLDQSPVREGGTAAQALAESVELARTAEALGYHRFWLAEHHGNAGLACVAPEIVIAHVAAQTSSIRVGSGGVMLTHYASLKVA